MLKGPHQVIKMAQVYKLQITKVFRNNISTFNFHYIPIHQEIIVELQENAATMLKCATPLQ